MAAKSRATAAALVIAGVLVLGGIGAYFFARAMSQPPNSPMATQGSSRPADRVYRTRGRITMLPSPGKPTSTLVIHHEAIDEFVNTDGSRGMNAMEMPMPTGADVSLGGFQVGDAVDLDLSVWYRAGGKGIESYKVTRMEKLPPETELKFGTAVPTLGGD